MNIEVISFCPITCRREKGDCDTVVTSTSNTPSTTKRRERLAGSTLQREKNLHENQQQRREKGGSRGKKKSKKYDQSEILFKASLANFETATVKSAKNASQSARLFNEPRSFISDLHILEE